jgi:hypothetical protein
VAISLSFSVKELLAGLSKQEAETVAAGGLDGSEVWYEYLTQADDRVRPSHAALHGTRWRADDPNAPTPPLDYGCRCFIRYIAAPNSVAAEVLPEADGPLSNMKAAFTQWLDGNVDGWKAIRTEAKKLNKADQLQFIIDELVESEAANTSTARDVAFMILSVF